MDLVFVTNARFSRNDKNEIYGIHTSVNRDTLQNYLSIFDKVFVVGRVENISDLDTSNAVRVDDENIEVLPLPYFIGISGYLRNRKQVKKLLKEYLKINAANIFRIPSSYGRISATVLHKIKKPFGVEVVGDPYDVFAPGTFKHPLRIIIRYLGYFYLKRTTKKASAAIYVTDAALQKRYPVNTGVYKTSASDVILDEDAYAKYSKVLKKKQNYNIISVGSLDQMYKGPDILLKAVELLKNKYNVKVYLKWMGDGKFKNEMIQFSKKLGVADEVNFLGVVKPVEKLINELDTGDLFVLASRTEGLPRALVEAMARGLPCVSTNIGGIPELISENALVNINDHKVLAKKIYEVISNPVLANELANQNFLKSKEFEYSFLKSKRDNFFQEVKKLTNNYYKNNNK